MPEVPYETFVANLERGSFECPSLIAVGGGEDFLRADAISRLRAHLIAKGFDLESPDPFEIEGESLRSLLKGSSLFGSKTAVVLKNRREGNRREVVVRLKDELLDYADTPSRNNVLVFDGETWQGNLAVPKRIKKDFLVITCPEFKPWQVDEVCRVIDLRAHHHGLKLQRDVADVLREACGGELGRVDRELEKLALVVRGRAATVQDVKAHLKFQGEDGSLDLADAILRGDSRAALGHAAGFASETDSGVLLMLLGLIESQYRKLAILSEELATGNNPTSALQAAGFNPRHPKKDSYIAQARKLPPAQLSQRFRVLLEADLESKSGSGDIGTQILRLVSGLLR